jgi:hypothetical protein
MTIKPWGAALVAAAALSFAAPEAADGEQVDYTGPTNFAVGGVPGAMVSGQFNGDSDPDLAIVRLGNVSILLGSAGGTFTGPTNYAVGANALSLAIGDFDGDAHQDLAVSNGGDVNISILLGAGDGTFGPASTVPVAGALELTSIVTGEFNGDSNPDLAVGDLGDPSTAVPGSIEVLLGAGGGSFGAATAYPFTAPGDHPRTLAVGDFDGDADPDLAVGATTVGPLTPVLALMKGGAGGSFAQFSQTPTSVSVKSIAVGELNGDTDPDLAVAPFSTANSVGVSLGAAGMTFTAGGAPVVQSGASSVAIGDLNGDPYPDLAVTNGGSSNVSVLLGAPGGTGTFSGPTNFATALQPVSVVIGDFDGDGRRDLATANATSQNVSILLGTAPAQGAPGPPGAGGSPGATGPAGPAGQPGATLICTKKVKKKGKKRNKKTTCRTMTAAANR